MKVAKVERRYCNAEKKKKKKENYEIEQIIILTIKEKKKEEETPDSWIRPWKSAGEERFYVTGVKIVQEKTMFV